MGYPFQRRFLERGIKNCGSRLYLLLKIVADYEETFFLCKSRTNKDISFYKTALFQFTNFLEWSIKNWPISRMVVSVLGRILERGIKNWPISRTGYQFYGNFF